MKLSQNIRNDGKEAPRPAQAARLLWRPAPRWLRGNHRVRSPAEAAISGSGSN